VVVVRAAAVVVVGGRVLTVVVVAGGAVVVVVASREAGMKAAVVLSVRSTSTRPETTWAEIPDTSNSGAGARLPVSSWITATHPVAAVINASALLTYSLLSNCDPLDPEWFIGRGE
jgi:hypothetical protein